MKKNIIINLVIMGLFTLLSNCSTGPVNGALYTNVTFPGEINTSNSVQSLKKGEGCVHTILHLVTFGKASAGKIALENKISRIATIDHSTISVIGALYKNYCTIVSGE